MKKLLRNYFVLKLALVIFALSAVVGFAAQNEEAVGRALNILRPEVKVHISGIVRRDSKSLPVDKVEAVKSGEILDWKISSTNDGNASAENYRVVGQIPDGTVFVADSAHSEQTAKVSYSIDGGKTFSAQPLIDQKQADGSVKQVPAPISMYSQLRFEWANELPAQSNFSAAYQVRVK